MNDSWRRSKIAVILDFILMPIMIPYSIFIQGFPNTVKDFTSHVSYVIRTWKDRGWMKENKND